MSDVFRFYVSVNSSCGHAVTTPIYGFSIVIKLLKLKLIVRCKANYYEQFYKYERMFFKYRYQQKFDSITQKTLIHVDSSWFRYVILAW